jgi:hypothetical protein
MEDEMVVEFAMAGVCCAPEEDHHYNMERAEGRQADRRWIDATLEASGQGERPLRSAVLSMLKEHKRKIDRLHTITNATAAGELSPEAAKVVAKLRAEAKWTEFYDPQAEALDGAGQAVRCLCPAESASSRLASSRRLAKRGGPGIGPGGGSRSAGAGPGPRSAGVGPGSVGSGSVKVFNEGADMSAAAAQSSGGGAGAGGGIAGTLSAGMTGAIGVAKYAHTQMSEPVDAEFEEWYSGWKQTISRATGAEKVVNFVGDGISTVKSFSVDAIDGVIGAGGAETIGNGIHYVATLPGISTIVDIASDPGGKLIAAPVQAGLNVVENQLVAAKGRNPDAGVGAQVAMSLGRVVTAAGQLAAPIGAAAGTIVGTAGVGTPMAVIGLVGGVSRPTARLIFLSMKAAKGRSLNHAAEGDANDYDYDYDWTQPPPPPPPPNQEPDTDHEANGGDQKRNEARRVAKEVTALTQGLLKAFGDFDFDQIADANKSVLAPGGTSMPHRFFTPGVYLWHDARHPALHGALIVEPSDYRVDLCGVCGGDGTSCLDCSGTPFGTATVNSCGECAGGDTGLPPNYGMDCSGVCNGNTCESQVRPWIGVRACVRTCERALNLHCVLCVVTGGTLDSQSQERLDQ